MTPEKHALLMERVAKARLTQESDTIYCYATLASGDRCSRKRTHGWFCKQHDDIITVDKAHRRR